MSSPQRPMPVSAGNDAASPPHTRQTSLLASLRMPPGTWMLKPRSKFLGAADGDAHVKDPSSLLSFRGFGAQQWKRRYVYVDGSGICYGKEMNRKDKVVFFGSIRDISAVQEDAMRKEKAPKNVAMFGWRLATSDKLILFACESRTDYASWAQFAEALSARLAQLRASPVMAPPRSYTASSDTALSPAPSSDLPGSPQPLLPTPPLHSVVPENTDAEPPREDAVSRVEEDNAPNYVHEGLQWDRAPVVSAAAAAAPTTRPDDGDPLHVADTDLQDAHSSSSTSTTPSASLEGRLESRRSLNSESEVGSGSSANSINSDDAEDVSGGSGASSNTTSERDSDEEEQDEEEEEEEQDTPEEQANKAAEAARLQEEDTRNDRLRRLARETTHSYLSGRLPALAPHFASNDNTTNVVFSAVLDKVGKHNNAQPREVVLTRKHLYLFSRKRVGGGTKSRCVPVSAITGVCESSTSPSLLAVLVPSFHDILLRVPTTIPGAETSRRTVTGSDDSDVKTQLIAHLFAVHEVATGGRCFRFERVDRVDGAIRRREEDPSAPLTTTSGDKMRAAVLLPLAALLSVNGDTRVYWSSVVREAHAGAPPQLRAIVVTDGALYMLSETLAKVTRRTPWCNVNALLYDRDAQSILLQCSRTAGAHTGSYVGSSHAHRHDDTLFSVQLAAEFQGVLSAIRQAAKEGYRCQLKTAVSKQLYSQAKLPRSRPKSGSKKSAGEYVGADPLTPGARKKPRKGLTSKLKDAWRAGMRQESKYLARLRSSGKKPSKGDDGLDAASTAAGDTLSQDTMLAMLGPNASFAIGPGGGASSLFVSDSGGDDDDDDEELSGAAVVTPGNGTIIEFQAQYRFVEELVRDYEDYAALLDPDREANAARSWDSLHLYDSLRLLLRKTTTVVFSALCQRLSTKAIASLAKIVSGGGGSAHVNVFRRFGEPRVLCLTEDGVFVLHRTVLNNAANGKGDKRRPSVFSATGSSGPALTPPTDSRVELFVPWGEVDAVLRCHTGSGAVIGIMTRDSNVHDILLDLGEEASVPAFVQAATACYKSSGERVLADEVDRGVALDEPLGTPIIPLFAAPRPESVAKALRKLVYDPFPTVALRYTPQSCASDRLQLAVVLDVAEPCRRFGDNTLYFSGMGWRFRSATLRKLGDGDISDPGPTMHRRNNHLYKSFMLIVTNAAIYYCTKGGYEVIRRTELTRIKSVYVHEKDPDTLLLTIPSEYDMYFRVAGRGPELLTRLREAVLEWTDYGLYKLGERVGSHEASDYFVPVTFTSPVAPLGTLTKPDEFNAVQASRSAAECRQLTEQWHLRYLRKAISACKRAQKTTSVSLDAAPLPIRPPSSAPGEPSLQHWPAVEATLGDCYATLHFAQRRAFRFGLRAEVRVEMAVAERLLQRYSAMRAAADALMSAVATADPESYRTAAENAAAFSELASMLAEQSHRFEGFVEKREFLLRVLDALDTRGSTLTASDGAEDPLSCGSDGTGLEALLIEAEHLGFDDTVLSNLRSIRAMKAEQDKVCTWLEQSGSKDSLRGNPAAQALVAAAAAEIGVSVDDSTFAKTDITLAQEGTLDSNSVNDSDVTDDTAADFEDLAASLTAMVRAGSGNPVSALKQQCNEVRERLRLFEEGPPSSRSPAALKAADVLRVRLTEADHAASVLSSTRTARHEVRELGKALRAPSVLGTLDSRTVTQLSEQASRLQSALPESEDVLAPDRAVLRMHRRVLAEHQHRLTLHETHQRQEKMEQHRYEADMQENREATRKTEELLQRKDLAKRTRRQKTLLSAWTRSASKRCAELHDALAVCEEASGTRRMDETLVRSCVKQCVTLQRSISEGTRLQLDVMTGDDDEVVQARMRFSAETDAVCTQLHDAAEYAHRCLLQSERATAGLYEPSSTPLLSASKRAAPDGDVSMVGSDRSGNAGSAPQRVRHPLAEELAHILARHDAAALVRYVEEHEDALSPEDVQEVRDRWDASARDAARVRQLHRAIECARVLSSKELLQRAVSMADETGHHDVAVEEARRALATSEFSISQPAVTECATENDEVGGRVMRATNGAAVPQPEATPLQCRPEGDGDAKENPEARIRDNTTGPAQVDAASLSGTPHATSPTSPVTAKGACGDPPSIPPSMTAGQTSGATAWRAQDQPRKEEAAAPINQAVKEDLLSSLPAVASPATASGATPHARALVTRVVGDVRSLVAQEPSLLLLPCVGDAQRDGACAAVTDSKAARTVLMSWADIFTAHLKPAGFFNKTPRSAFDLLEFVGNHNEHGSYTAPYTNRLVSDQRRRMALPVGQPVPNTPMLAPRLVTAMLHEHTMERVVHEVLTTGPSALRDVVLEDSPLSYPLLLKDLLLAARVCDRLRWPSWTVMSGGASRATARPEQSPAPSSLPQTPRATPSESRSLPSPAKRAVESRGALASPEETQRNAPGNPPDSAGASERQQLAARCAKMLQSSVSSISLYFTSELKRVCSSEVADTSRAAADLGHLFDESLHSSIIPVISDTVIPALVSLLEAGLVRRFQLFRTRTVWDVLLAFREHLQMSARHIAGSEVVSTMELVEALTNVDTGGHRFTAALAHLSEEELHALRVRCFIRECANRRQLYGFFDAFFSAPGDDAAWNGSATDAAGTAGSGDGIWKFYSREQCVMLPRDDDTASAPLWAVLQRLCALPFTLAVDRELR